MIESALSTYVLSLPIFQSLSLDEGMRSFLRGRDNTKNIYDGFHLAMGEFMCCAFNETASETEVVKATKALDGRVQAWQRRTRSRKAEWFT